MSRDIVIVGAGGFAREVAGLIADIADADGSVRAVGFLSDDPAAHGTQVGDLRVIGGLE